MASRKLNLPRRWTAQGADPAYAEARTYFGELSRPRFGGLARSNRAELMALLSSNGSSGELLALVLVDVDAARLLSLPITALTELLNSARGRIAMIREENERQLKRTKIADRMRGKRPVRFKCDNCGHVNKLIELDPRVCENCAEPLQERQLRGAALLSRRHREVCA